jgi:hypothetical protein
VNEVSPRPGQVAGDVADGINVRFDLTPNGNTSGMDQTPAPSVIKGIKPDKPQNLCQFNGSGYISDVPPNLPNGYMLPGATSWTTTGILSIGSPINPTGATTYWNYHHGGNPWPGPPPATRYQAYCQELGLGNDCQGNNSAPSFDDVNNESHVPQCAPASVRNSGTYKRRLISVAVINCLAQGVQGNQATNVRSNQYAVFFLTSPSPTSQPGVLNNYLGSATNGDIMAEFVEMVTPAGCAANPASPFCNGLHQVVQLYR